MQLSEEQLQLREILRDFFRKNISQKYLRQRCQSSEPSDKKLASEIEKLGLNDFFSDGSSSKLVELGIVAFESGYCLLPEFLTERLFAAAWVCGLPDLKGRAVSYAGYQSELPELNASKQKSKLILKGLIPGDYLIFRAVQDKKEKVFHAPLKQQKDADYLDLSMKYVEAEVDLSKAVEISGIDPLKIQSEFLAFLSSMLAGTARKTLDLSVEYVKTRKQFGQAVGSFQAVQHHLAEMYLKSESIKSLSDFACFAAVNSPQQLLIASHSAIRHAIVTAPEVAEKAIQVHGGIGFTWEYDLHLYLRRIKTQQALCTVINDGSYTEKFLEQINF